MHDAGTNTLDWPAQRWTPGPCNTGHPIAQLLPTQIPRHPNTQTPRHLPAPHIASHTTPSRRSPPLASSLARGKGVVAAYLFTYLPTYLPSPPTRTPNSPRLASTQLASSVIPRLRLHFYLHLHLSVAASAPRPSPDSVSMHDTCTTHARTCGA